MKETESMKKMRYYKMLNECCEAAINRLDPMADNFQDSFDELFTEQSDALAKYFIAAEEVKLQNKKKK